MPERGACGAVAGRRAALDPAEVAARIVALVLDTRMVHVDEAGLQTTLAQVIAAAGLPVEREVALNERDRIDILVGRVGVEVKVNGSPAAVARQLVRYAASDRVDRLVLVTTQPTHAGLAGSAAGKPLHVAVSGTPW